MECNKISYDMRYYTTAPCNITSLSVNVPGGTPGTGVRGTKCGLFTGHCSGLLGASALALHWHGRRTMRGTALDSSAPRRIVHRARYPARRLPDAAKTAK